MKKLKRDNLYRAQPAGVELRATDGEDGMPTLSGHFAVFDQFTEIDSVFEGHFLERIAPGAFKKTMRENRDSIKVLFQHGQDPTVGDKVLGPLESLSEDEKGGAYEVPLLDTSYNRDLIPGLKAGLYGASFRFRVMREDVVDQPKPSEQNPRGLPERTIREVQLYELGPVTFPAYSGATATARSLTDYFNEEARAESTRGSAPEPPPDTEPEPDPDPAPDDDSAEPEAHPAAPRREHTPRTHKESTMQTIEELRARLEEITERFKSIAAEQGTHEFASEARAEWDDLLAEREELERRVAAYEERLAVVQQLADRDENRERGSDTGPARRDTSTRAGRSNVTIPGDMWNVAEYRNHNPWERLGEAYREGARRAVDQMTFPHQEVDQADAQEHIERLIDQLDGENAVISTHVLETGSPLYQRAFGKYLAERPLTPEEDNALKRPKQRGASLTTTAGGFAVPVMLDPTVILTSNGQINPLRQISRVVQITGSVWEGVSSVGITAAFAAEATETTDGAPYLLQPSITVEKAQALVPMTIEITEDWAGIQSEMAMMLTDAKDQLEVTKFTTGYGHATNTPEGYLKGGTAIVTSATTATLAVADLFTCKNALPPRFRTNASWVAEGTQLDRIRNFGTTYGSSFWTELGGDRPPVLLGKSVYENSAAPSATATATSAVTYGDFSRAFVIVDRVGLTMELIPHLFNTNANLPDGRRAIYAYWRTSSGVVAAAGLRTIKLL